MLSALREGDAVRMMGVGKELLDQMVRVWHLSHYLNEVGEQTHVKN